MLLGPRPIIQFRAQSLDHFHFVLQAHFPSRKAQSNGLFPSRPVSPARAPQTSSFFPCPRETHVTCWLILFFPRDAAPRPASAPRLVSLAFFPCLFLSRTSSFSPTCMWAYSSPSSHARMHHSRSASLPLRTCQLLDIQVTLATRHGLCTTRNRQEDQVSASYSLPFPPIPHARTCHP